MQSETRQCQNCKKDFVIEPDDFAFYEKMKVPAPTWCPECRLQRRFAWRNEWKLMRKKDIHGKEIFSMYHEDSPVKILEVAEWYSDSWDPMEYGKEYDFSKSFFEQFKELLHQVPLMSRPLINPIRSDFSSNATEPKDCYLCFAASYIENCAYSIWGAKSKDIVDCYIFNESELCYDCVDITKCYKTLFSVSCEDCNEVVFSKNCVGCNNCFGCINLKNKSYHIFNEPCSKEKYAEKLKEFGISSRKNIETLRQQAIDFWIKFPNKYIHGRHNQDVSGNYIYNSKNSKHCWRLVGGENLKYCQNFTVGPAKDSYDHSNFGNGSELIYESLGVGKGVYDVAFSSLSFGSVSNLRYCFGCLQNSSFLFGCIGLRNKQYCILNKRYTKEEYEALVPKIIAHMNEMPYIDKKGCVYKYGEFFPTEMSPTAYNESFAQDFFPLTKKEVEEQGFVWREQKNKEFNATKSSPELPDYIKDVDDSILKEVISCPHAGKCEHECNGVFKITKQELQFYKKLNIPLPQTCQNCRHYARFAWRNPPKLWHRSCMRPGCTNEFETSYAPDRPEIVYCESCYQQEVA
ncbi:MAG: hypothetical protein NTW11_02655 [Candidatus Staskawiczbacteria bacterium]|nr:hypothetical protein [Candidatus Staskawiczbacteria bacterium]